MYNGRALLRPLRVLIYSGRVPSGPHLQWSGPFASSSGPFGSSFRLVGSNTPFGLYTDTTRGRGVGGTLNTRAGLPPQRDSSRWGGSKILQWGRSVGGILNTRAGCGRYLIEILAGGAGRKLVLRPEVVQPQTLDRIIPRECYQKSPLSVA